VLFRSQKQIMRTKTLLLTAAVLAAGLGASMAQSVFSVNAVGYVNVPLVAGYNLIANPLNGTNNNIRTIMPVAPDGTILYHFNRVTQQYNQADTYFNFTPPDNTWYDNNFDPSTTIIAPGEGFFLKVPPGPATNITFVGDVPQGGLTNTIVNHYGFYSSIVPQSGTLTSLGFPTGAAADGMNYYSWDSAQQKYRQALTYFNFTPPDNGWYNNNFDLQEPTPGVAEGFLLLNPNSSVAWGRTFSVN